MKSKLLVSHYSLLLSKLMFYLIHFLLYLTVSEIYFSMLQEHDGYLICPVFANPKSHYIMAPNSCKVPWYTKLND